jgi:hypothetical protein
MALKIAKNSGLTDIVSSGTGANAVTTQHPITGSAQSVQLYLFNDSSAERFESITIDPTDTTGADESTWVQLSANGSTWLNAGEALTMADIADNGVGKSFWVRVTSPAVGNVQNKTDIKLTVNYRKFAV